MMRSRRIDTSVLMLSMAVVCTHLTRGGHFKTENQIRNRTATVGLFEFSGSGSVPIRAIFRGTGLVPNL
jgi:hypothetical protein